MGYDLSFLNDLGVETSFSDTDRDQHASDWGAESRGQGVKPDVVVWPESTDEVSRVLEEANERVIPVTPYAAGTSIEGNAVPAFKGISMDLSRMDSVLDLRPEDFQIDLEPGVYGSRIDEEAAKHGLFFPPLPSSGDISTIGGMIANDASGMQTVKYGEIRDWVLELEAVLADGSVVKAGSKAVKTSSGYNLRDLLIGSEGTLGVVTRATLELKGIPKQKRGGRALFDSLDDATSAVSDAVQSGVDVAKIELIDSLSAEMANKYVGTDLPDTPMVFLEFHANHGVENEVEFCEEIFEAHDVSLFEIADDELEMDSLWEARKELAFAVQTYDPDKEPLHPGDVTVPISRYPEMIEYIKSLGDENSFLTPCFGHAGDGNVHYAILVDKDNEDEVEKAKKMNAEIVEKAVEMGGTSTGEHGIGQGKREYLVKEHGEESVQAMRALKLALDPRDILNPGKIFPETVGGGRIEGRQEPGFDKS